MRVWLLFHFNQPLCSVAVVRLVASARSRSTSTTLPWSGLVVEGFFSKPLVVYQTLVILFFFVACLTKVLCSWLLCIRVCVAYFYVVCLIIFFFLSISVVAPPEEGLDVPFLTVNSGGVSKRS